MSDRGDDRLPPAIDRLLQAERMVPPPPPKVARRVFRRLGHSLGLPVASGSLLTGKTYLIAALLAAGTVGVLTRARKPPSGGAAVTSSARTEAAPRMVAAHSPAPAEEAPSPVEIRPPDPVARPVSRPVEDGLARENALLLKARRALASGDAAAALVPLRHHARRWPRGALEQEREILLMEALARSGQQVTAQRLAETFLRRFPDSTLAEAARRHLVALQPLGGSMPPRF